MKNKNKIYIISGIFIVILIWSIIALIVNNNNIFPSFASSFANMFNILFTTNLIVDILFSFLRILISFVIGAIIGISLGVFAGISKKGEYTILPIMTFLKAIPTLAFILLFIIYVKFSYIYIVSILIIPIVYQATTHAINTNKNRYLNIFLMRNGKIDIHSIIKVLIPASSTEIINGFIQSFSLGIKAQVLVESFSSRSSFRGIGKLIYVSFQNSEILNMTSMVLLIVLVSLLIDLVLTSVKNKINENI